MFVELGYLPGWEQVKAEDRYVQLSCPNNIKHSSDTSIMWYFGFGDGWRNNSINRFPATNDQIYLFGDLRYEPAGTLVENHPSKSTWCKTDGSVSVLKLNELGEKTILGTKYYCPKDSLFMW